MDPLDTMTEPIGSALGRYGVNAAVNLRRDHRLVTVVLDRQDAPRIIGRDFAPLEAHELADLLDEAADYVNQPGYFDDDMHEVGRVTTSDAQWFVDAQWPTVRPWLYNIDGALHLEFTPENARGLGRFLRKGADKLQTQPPSSP
jgi:hypothetical protein